MPRETPEGTEGWIDLGQDGWMGKDILREMYRPIFAVVFMGTRTVNAGHRSLVDSGASGRSEA